jgi:hypothetical protein
MGIFSSIAAPVALVVSILAIVTFLATRRKTAIEEGKHLKTVEQLGKDLNNGHAKIRQLETVSHEQDVTIAEIKSDLKYLVGAVNRIEGKLDERIMDGR